MVAAIWDLVRKNCGVSEGKGYWGCERLEGHNYVVFGGSEFLLREGSRRNHLHNFGGQGRLKVLHIAKFHWSRKRLQG